MSHSRSHGDEKSTTCAPNQPLRFRGSITQLVGLGEDATQVNAEVQVEVVQGLANEVRVQLPEHFTVNQVSGAMVADWDVANHELKVLFIEPVQNNRALYVERRVAPAACRQVDVPLLRCRARNAKRAASGSKCLGAGEIKERQPNGLEEAEAGELGQLISSRQSPSLIAFRLQPGDGKSHARCRSTSRVTRRRQCSPQTSKKLSTTR